MIAIERILGVINCWIVNFHTVGNL